VATTIRANDGRFMSERTANLRFCTTTSLVFSLFSAEPV
jgi:hypothetical protein